MNSAVKSNQKKFSFKDSENFVLHFSKSQKELLSKKGPLSYSGFRMWNPSENIAKLSPGYFALVMATGIVSIAAQSYEFYRIAEILFYFNIVAYLWLLGFSILRFVFYRQKGIADFYNLNKSPGFLSFVAGTAVLGAQFVVIWENFNFGVGLYFLSVFTWTILIYAFFTVITIANNKPKFTKSINGSWLLIIVSTQSIAVLGTLLVRYFDFHSVPILFLSLLFYLCGCLFYLFIITFIIFRMSFFDLPAREFAPSYWINMGATAISVLAGSLLILNAGKWSFLQDILPFLKGFTLLYWAIGSWWIPFVIIMGIWRTVLKQLPLRYHPLYWSMVFPLGMYTVCTIEMATALELPFLMKIPQVFVYIAIGSWAITFFGLVNYYHKNAVFTEETG